MSQESFSNQPTESKSSIEAEFEAWQERVAARHELHELDPEEVDPLDAMDAKLRDAEQAPQSPQRGVIKGGLPMRSRRSSGWGL